MRGRKNYYDLKNKYEWGKKQTGEGLLLLGSIKVLV